MKYKFMKYKSNSAVSHIATLSCGRWVRKGAVLPTKIINIKN